MQVVRNSQQEKKEPRPVGRPKTGKSSNEDYVHTSICIPKNLHRDVAIALIDDKKKRDRNDLIAELLSSWLKYRDRD